MGFQKLRIMIGIITPEDIPSIARMEIYQNNHVKNKGGNYYKNEQQSKPL